MKNDKSILNVFLYISLYFSDCIYVEAREIESEYDWVGSNNTLAYPLDDTDSNSRWGIGISTNVGYVTNLMSI